MRKFLLILPIFAVGILSTGCPPGGGGNVEIKAEAVNDGADLKLTWTSVEGVSTYKVLDENQNVIAEVNDTTYTLAGADGVYSEIYIQAGDTKTKLDLTPWEGSVSDIVSHDLTGNSWVKVDFTTPSVNAIQQSDVDVAAANTGYFILYNNGGTPELRDAGATSVGAAKMEMAFSDNSSGDLAPGTGNYNTARGISDGGFYFFWADNTSTGYGSIDANDYFGAVKVTSLSNSGGGYTANFTIYIQNKVDGLRWLKVQ